MDARAPDGQQAADASAGSGPIDGPPLPPPLPPPPDDPADAGTDASPDLPPPGAPGLVGHWKFDEDSGTLASDSSGSDNHGTLGPGAVFVAGGFPGARFPNRGAIELDGVEGRVVLRVNRFPAAGASQTISFWLELPAVPAAIQATMSLTNGPEACGVQIGFRDRLLAVWGWAGTVLVSAQPPAPGWHNVIYGFDGVTHTLFVDGRPEGSSTAPPQSCQITDAVVSGYAGGAENFFGTIDDFRIYDRALTAIEIGALATGSEP